MIGAVLDHLWQSTLFALVLAFIAAGSGKAPAAFRHSLWLTASVKFLVPFSALEVVGRQQAPDVDGPVVPGQHHPFVAGPLALLDHPGADPPDHRVEPEQRLHQHMQRGGEVVAAAQVAAFVRHDGLDLGPGQMLEQRRGNQQHRTPDAHQSRLQHGGGGQHRHRRGPGQRRGGKHRGAHLGPRPTPGDQDDYAAQGPDAEEDRRRIDRQRRMQRGDGWRGLREGLGRLGDEMDVR